MLHTCSKHNYTGTERCPDCELAKMVESEEKFNEFCEEWLKSTGYGQAAVGEFSREVYKKYHLIQKRK